MWSKPEIHKSFLHCCMLNTPVLFLQRQHIQQSTWVHTHVAGVSLSNSEHLISESLRTDIDSCTSCSHPFPPGAPWWFGTVCFGLAQLEASVVHKRQRESIPICRYNPVMLIFLLAIQQTIPASGKFTEHLPVYFDSFCNLHDRKSGQSK